MGSQESPLPLPFWHVNIPPSQRTPLCPPFLTNLTPKDQSIIGTPDAQFSIHTWSNIQSLVLSNRLDLFERRPSDLRRYYEFNFGLKQEYGSVMRFILEKRLRWEEPVVPREKPFVDSNDVKILRNDWPYGVEEGVVHLVVWTKFVLEADPVTDDLTDEARGEIEAYVREKFTRRVGEDNVIWFKNWTALKSVHAVEHFHVMLNNPDPEFLREITNGDVPVSEKV